MGQIKIASTPVNKIYIGGKQVKKVYVGSTLIWENGSGPTPPTPTSYSYSWSFILVNNSVSMSPAMVGEVGDLVLYQNGVEIAREGVMIPDVNQSVSGSIEFTSDTLYTSLSADYTWDDRVDLFTDKTITFTESSGTYIGSPVRVAFSIS